MAVLVYGMGRTELPRVLDLVERDCDRRGITPLFLTDCDGLDLFRARRQIFEYLPPLEARARFAPDLHWELYLQRRLALIRRKWRPVRVVAFGAEAANVARSWARSPFEDMPLPGLPRSRFEEVESGEGAAAPELGLSYPRALEPAGDPHRVPPP